MKCSGSCPGGCRALCSARRHWRRVLWWVGAGWEGCSALRTPQAKRLSDSPVVTRSDRRVVIISVWWGGVWGQGFWYAMSQIDLGRTYGRYDGRAQLSVGL